MKTRLNITIEQNLLDNIKVYAEKKRVSVSQLIENYFETVIHVSGKRKTILDMVDKLNPDPKVVEESSRKESFYEAQSEKYGF